MIRARDAQLRSRSASLRLALSLIVKAGHGVFFLRHRTLTGLHCSVI